MNAGPACRLVVLRHGQSEGNAAGRFTGWVNGIPLVYQLGPDLRPVAGGGQYLDPLAARDGIEATRNQGRPAPAAVSTT